MLNDALSPPSASKRLDYWQSEISYRATWLTLTRHSLREKLHFKFKGSKTPLLEQFFPEVVRTTLGDFDKDIRRIFKRMRRRIMHSQQQLQNKVTNTSGDYNTPTSPENHMTSIFYFVYNKKSSSFQQFSILVSVLTLNVFHKTAACYFDFCF